MSMSQTLVLTVQGPQAAQFGSRKQKTFSGKDGSIGRSEDCDWTLQSAGVSRVHAMVRCLNGIYFIEDRSTNGMLLNGTPLVKGEPSALKDGDRLQIDTFEVVVSMEQDSATVVQPSRRPPAAGNAPPADTGPDPWAAPAPAAPPSAAAAPTPSGGLPDDLDFSDLGLGPAAPRGDSLIPEADSGASGDLDPLSFLGSEPEPPPAAPQASWNHSAGTSDHFHPPGSGSQRPAETLPENWDLTMGDFGGAAAPSGHAAPPPTQAPVPTPAEPAPSAPAATPASAAAPVAAAVPDALAPILDIVTEGVMEVLRARAEIKNTFRLPVTIIQRSENNPLKFAATAEDALQKILGNPGHAFLSGPAAFDDAFDDIRCHQMAMLAGVRAGFEAALAHFNPDRFENDTDSRRAAFGGKGRFWDKYREHYENLARNPDDCFRRLFGEAFAHAYEEQLARLKSARRAERGRG